MIRGDASDEEIKEWSDWIEKSEINRDKAKQAMVQIYGFEFDDPELPDLEKKWNQLSLDTSIDKAEPQRNYLNNFIENSWMVRVAAILLIISTVGAGLFLYSSELNKNPDLEQITLIKTITTSDNETKTLRFSDGSKITLNSNSRLRYKEVPLGSSTIEVTLNGNAFFESGEDQGAEISRFSISTPDGLIRDIGTKFQVNVENKLTRVITQEGIVEVKPHERSGVDKEIFIKKGELVEFNSKDLTKRNEVNPTFFTSWATGFMQFEKTSIKKVAQYLEVHYSVEVKITDPQLSNLTLDGAVYYRSLEELVRSISDVIKTPVFQLPDSNIIYIGKPESS